MHIKIFIITLVLMGAVNSVSVCPAGSISYDTFNYLAEDVLKHRSLNYDVFYRIIYDSGAFRLNCYRVADQETAPNPVLQLQNISIQGDRSWKIQAVSQRGSCVVVKQGSNLVAYNTYSGSFVQVQSVSVSSLGKTVQYSADDNCDLIRAIVTDTEGTVSSKIISSGVINDETTYPSGSIFSYDFQYAIDQSSKFYVSSSGSVTQRSISSLKSTPLYIKWSSVIQAVITISSDSTGYSLVVIDPASNANLYTKTLVSGTDYNGVLKYVVRTSYGSVLFRDDNGFVSFIQLSLNNSLLVGTEHTFDNSTYASLFTSRGQASVSNDILFAYNNKQVTYFQAYSGKIYYLGQLATDIEATGKTHRLQYSSKEINIVLALTAPTVLNFCSPIPITQSASTISAASNSQSATVVNQTTGQTLKCPDNCVTCTSSETCTICRIGYSLDDTTGKCTYCNGCLSCNPTNVTVCYLCFAPEVLNRTSSQCVLPQCTTPNCLQCDIYGVCTKCMLNYGLINNTCQKCTSVGCRSCSTGVNTCDSNSCMLGYVYYLNPTTNQGVCQPCATGCTVCLASDLSACSSCSTGYYPQADNTGVNRCVTCFTNCKSCSSATVCTKCISGYVPSTDGSSCTLKCNDNCLTCDQSNAATCLTCYAGSVLNTTTNKCIVDLSCNATSTCLYCGDGYVLNNNQCFKCTTSDANCIACLSSSISTCSECSNGYYLKDNQCIQCTGNCASCVGQDACYICNDGYYLVTDDNTETGSCQICDSSCQTCSGTSTTCTSCANGFSLEGSKCISDDRVIFQFVIQANVNNFIEFMEDLINWLVVSINDGKTIGAADITTQELALLNTQKYGSSIVNAIAGTSTSSNTDSVANSLNSALNKSPSVSGYLILSGSATAQTTNTASPTVASSSSSSIGIILGIVLPLGIICNEFILSQCWSEVVLLVTKFIKEDKKKRRHRHSIQMPRSTVKSNLPILKRRFHKKYDDSFYCFLLIITEFIFLFYLMNNFY